MNDRTIQRLERDIREQEDLLSHLVWEFNYYKSQMKKAMKANDLESKKYYFRLKISASQQKREVQAKLKSLYQVGD
jgi:hypothetical protein